VNKHAAPTQTNILKWLVEILGEKARNRDERAARLVEESIEIALTEGVPLYVLERILQRIYSRPAGELGQEIGGCAMALLALSENVGLDCFAEILREWQRVLSKPAGWWLQKHVEKVIAGTADLTPIGSSPPAPESGPVSKVDEHTIAIYGIRYSLELFKAMAFLQLGSIIRIYGRPEGMVTVQSLSTTSFAWLASMRVCDERTPNDPKDGADREIMARGSDGKMICVGYVRSQREVDELNVCFEGLRQFLKVPA
jgi:hypothetical protein